MTSPASASATCHLLKLPAELRNRIWHYALEEVEITATKARTVNTNGLHHIVQVLHNQDGCYQTPPSLLRVNRQIRSEARPICIALTTFNFDLFVLKEDVTSWKRWWKSLGQDVQYIRKIKLTGMTPRSSTTRLVETQTIIMHEGRERTTVTVRGSIRGSYLTPRYDALLSKASKDAQNLETQIGKCMQLFGSGKLDRQLLDHIYGILWRYCERSMFGFRSSLDEITLASTRARRTKRSRST